MLFIIGHQAYELWFKLQLHELEKIRRDFTDDHLYGAIATFKRVRTIMKVMVEQIDIVETLTPMSFNSFRDRLDTASGFQSSQFREFEFLLGYKRADDAALPAARHAGLRAAGPPAARAVGRGRLLRLPGAARRRDPGGAAAARPDAADRRRTRSSRRASCACTRRSRTWKSCSS